MPSHFISSYLFVNVVIDFRVGTQGVALQNIALALAVVFIALGVLSGFAIASVVTALVLGTTLGTVGLVSASIPIDA